jgi:hypothetical protein
VNEVKARVAALLPDVSVAPAPAARLIALWLAGLRRTRTIARKDDGVAVLALGTIRII